MTDQQAGPDSNTANFLSEIEGIMKRTEKPANSAAGSYAITDCHDQLQKVIGDILSAQQGKQPPSIEDLTFIRDIARSCTERFERIQRENSTLHHQINELSWIVINQGNIINGRHVEHFA